MEFKQLLKEIEQKKFSPIYLLFGDESYFIDAITKAITENALEEHERDFNQTVVYGKDVEYVSLLSELKSFPLMAERKLVVLKEAQDFAAKKTVGKGEELKGLDLFLEYAENPSDTTVFVIAFKSEKVDSRKKVYKAIQKNGVVFKSEKIKDYQLSAWMREYIKSNNYQISDKALMLLEESIGTNIGRFVNEFAKLSSVVANGTVINEVHIEENIGISREYNMFELTNAVMKKNFEKAMKIIQYFEGNPKAWDLSPVISMLFEQFSRVLTIHFLPTKTADFVAQQLRIHPFVAKETLAATYIYDPRKIASNIATLHEYDLKSKGVGSTGNIERSDLLRELTFKLIY